MGFSLAKTGLTEKQYTMIELLAAELKITITSDLNTLSRGTASMVIDQLSEAKNSSQQHRHIYYNEIKHRSSKFQFGVQA
jgi:hypothetical protein